MAGTDRVVICDLEAGIGTTTRLRDKQVDRFLVVVEATHKSIEVGRRVVDAAEARGADVTVIANRIATPADRALVERAFPTLQIVVVPHDESVRNADRRGTAPLDFDPTSPAVEALRATAMSLVAAPSG